MSNDATASASEQDARRLVLEAIGAALVGGVDQPPFLDWWSSQWRPERHLLGAARRPVPDHVTEAAVILARAHAERSGLPLAARHDEVLVRLFCGALLSVLADEGAGPRTGIPAPGDLGSLAGAAQNRDGGRARDDGGREHGAGGRGGFDEGGASAARALRAARVLWGVAPLDHYSALTGEDGTRIWTPAGRSREQIHQHLVGRQSMKAAAAFAGPVNPRALTTRRVLASFIDADAEYTLDAYSRPDRRRIRRIAEIVLNSALSALADPVAATRLLARLEGSESVSPGATTVRSARLVRIAALVATSVAALAGLLVLINALGGRGAWELVPSTASSPATSAASSDGSLAAAGSSSGEEVAGSFPASPLRGDPGGGVVPELSGAVMAHNSTSGDDDDDGWLDVVPGDEVTLTLTMTNDSRFDAEGLFLLPRAYTPPGSEDVRVIEFVVRHGAQGPEALVRGAAVALQQDADEACALEWVWSSGASLASDGADDLLPASQSFSTVPGEGVETLGQYALPPIRSGESVEITDQLHVARADVPGQIEGGGAVRFKDANDVNGDYRTAGEAAVGDVVEVAIRLHNISCQEGGSAKVTASVMSSDRGFLRVGARVAGDYLGRTALDPATINVAGRRPVRLEQVPGTTEVYANACDGWVPVTRANDWLLQGGVVVEVPGYIPRMDCEEHTRFLISDFVVVPAAPGRSGAGA